ncbi:MAG: carboxylate--amine ligase [Novosphingobium sp.]|nr:carboxylate--amine ligase [Novosphingobium sp.]
MNASARPVAVIGPDSPIGLTVVRELDEHGLRVLALGKSADSLARASRHATIFETIDGPLAEYLPKVVARHDPLAVLAISEHHLIALASLKGKLGDTKVLCPDPDKLAVVLDKRQTLEIAQGLGIEVPQSWQPLADEDRKSKAANLAYPVAIKWADPAEVSAPLEALGLPLEKVEYAASSEALIAILSRYDVLGLYPMVQEWCPGEGLGQMLNMQDGSATLTFQHRRLREWPPTGGVSSFCEAIDPAHHAAQMEKSETLLKEIGWQGPAMVEYRHDPATGRYKLMEINGRFWGSIPLAYHCGAHFAWEQVRLQALGWSAEATARPWRNRRARYAIPDAKHLVAVLRDGSPPILRRIGFAIRFFADFLDPRVRYYVWSWRDPMPMLADLAGAVRRKLKGSS